MDTPKSGQPPYNGQTACPLPTTVCMLEPPKKGQAPNNGQNTRPQRVHCSEVPLYDQNVCVCIHIYSEKSLNTHRTGVLVFGGGGGGGGSEEEVDVGIHLLFLLWWLIDPLVQIKTV